MKIIEAWPFAEGDGYGVSTKCTQEQAFEAIKKSMREFDDAKIADALKISDVKVSRLYKHRNCDVGTIGGAEACFDCGEPHVGSVGKPIFVWHRDQ